MPCRAFHLNCLQVRDKRPTFNYLKYSDERIHKKCIILSELERICQVGMPRSHSPSEGYAVIKDIFIMD